MHSFSFMFPFFQENRWRKRGMSIVPLRWGVIYPPGIRFTAYVAIFRKDGTVCITHGGVEIGQGIDTKVCRGVIFVPHWNSFTQSANII